MKFLYLSLLLITGNGWAQQEAKGLDPQTIRQMEAAIQDGTYPNIHSVLIARQGKLIYEHYWPGKDQILGDDLGVIAHGPDSLHDMRSVTKSFVSACIGIAIAQGKIKSIDLPVFSFFPEYAMLDTGMKKSLTLRHLLTMSSGLDWDETRPYSDPLNSEIAMDRSADPVEYALSQPMVHPPGSVWNYNGGTTQVLAAVIRKVSGEEIDAFAGEYLFKPLGITHWQWLKSPRSGTPSAAAGLRLRSPDLLKFGLMYSSEGKWKGIQIVPAQWVDSSLSLHIPRSASSPDNGGYGYQFWTFPETLKDGMWQVPTAVGNGDQRVFIDRPHQLVVVITSGKYNNWTERKNANALLKDYIYPALGLIK